MLNVGKKHKNKKLVVLKKEIKKVKPLKSQKEMARYRSEIKKKYIYKYTKPNNKKQHKHDGRKYRYLLSLSRNQIQRLRFFSLQTRLLSSIFNPFLD